MAPANHEHHEFSTPKAPTGTRHIPCTREIRFKQQILARRSLHFTSPICQFGSFGCYKRFDHVRPCSTHLFLSHYILDSTRRYASVHVQLVFCRQRPKKPKRGPKRISTGFQTRSHDSNMSDQKKKHNNNMEVPYPSLQNNKTLFKSIQFLIQSTLAPWNINRSQ